MSFAAAVAWVLANPGAVLGAILALKVVAEAIVNLTPTPADDRWVAKIYRVIEAIAGLLTDKAKEKPGQRDFVKRVRRKDATDILGQKKGVVIERTDMSEVDKFLGIKH